MASIRFNPNFYGSSVSLGGGASELKTGSTVTYTAEGTNYQRLSDDTYIKDFRFNGTRHASQSATINTPGITRVAAYVYMALGTISDGSIVAGEYDQWAIRISPLLGFNEASGVVVDVGTELASVNYSYQRLESGEVLDISEEIEGQSFPYFPFSPAGGYVSGDRFTGSLRTNVPLFLTEAEAREFLLTGEGTPLNEAEAIEGNNYDYFLYNIITSTVGAGADGQFFFRYKMLSNERLAFYLNEEAGAMYDRTLVGVSGIDKTYEGASPLEDPMPLSSPRQLNFLGAQKKLTNGTSYTPVMYQTNIPTFDTKEHAERYLLDGEEEGMQDKWRLSGIEGGVIGEPTDETEQGTNGALFSFGGGVYRMNSTQLASFYGEVFDSDPNILNAILEGLQLFGANQINAISDVMYLPFRVDEVATLSAGNDIYLGAYKIQRTTGDRVLKNDKLINMGTHYFAPPYGAGDFRNLEPACKLYIMLPYAGTHELQISKYLGKNVTLKMACDVTTGQATYFLFADAVIMDSFDCCIGAHRPITATDHARHVSASLNAILQTGTSAIKSIEQGVSAGLEDKSILNGALAGAGAAGGAVIQGYGAMNIINDAPMRERGSFSGFVGMFDVKSPYFIFAQLKPQAPVNLQQIAGKPSSTGGLVGSFSGFLSCCAFDLAEGFTGTEEEAEEIKQLMRGGIYID